MSDTELEERAHGILPAL